MEPEWTKSEQRFLCFDCICLSVRYMQKPGFCWVPCVLVTRVNEKQSIQACCRCMLHLASWVMQHWSRLAHLIMNAGSCEVSDWDIWVWL